MSKHSAELINPLTSLRFFAALAVFVYHLGSTGFIDKSDLGKFSLYQGVSFFFVLSGFVLQHNYREKILDTGFGNFIFLRFARLYPLHFLTLLLTAIAFGVGGPGQLIANLAMVQSWIPDEKYYFSLNAVSWTLSDEMFFYVCFPILTVALRRQPITLIVFIGLCAIAYFQMFQPSDATIANAHYGICPLARLPEFVLGMATKETSGLLGRLRLPIVLWTGLELFSLGIMIFANWNLPFFPDDIWLAGGMPLTSWVWNVGCAPAFAFVILVFSVSGGFISKILSTKSLVLLGEISFGFYLFHPLALHIAERLGVPKSIEIVAGFLMTLGLAYTGWRFLEKPVMRWAKRAATAKPRTMELVA